LLWLQVINVSGEIIESSGIEETDVSGNFGSGDGSSEEIDVSRMGITHSMLLDLKRSMFLKRMVMKSSLHAASVMQVKYPVSCSYNKISF
jgi:hypothetical protein